MKTDIVILIAEDNDEHFELIKENLRGIGIRNEIYRFSNGHELSEFLFTDSSKSKQMYNSEYLLFLDVALPGVNGIDILRKIKADPALRKIAVIVLTAEEDDAIIKDCYESGCNIYIVKPLEDRVFADTVRKIGAFISAIEMPQIRTT